MHRWFLCVLLVGLLHPLSAQNRQLSLGLSTTYYPSGVAGLGGTADYRWRSGGSYELIGQFTAMRFWRNSSQQDGHNGPLDAFNLYFGGIGFGYRVKPQGFHIGLVGGGMRYLTTVSHKGDEPRIMPALGLTMGHGIAQRMDLSLDTWGLLNGKEVFVLPMLRLSYGLCSHK